MERKGEKLAGKGVREKKWEGREMSWDGKEGSELGKERGK